MLIAQFPALKEPTVKQIYAEMLGLSGPETVQDSSVTKQRCVLCFLGVETPSGKVEQSDAFTEIDLAIVEALEELPFS
jgi:hypothetical protein